MTELSDEIELLKLRLDIAETEKYEAAQQVASESMLWRQGHPDLAFGAPQTLPRGCKLLLGDWSRAAAGRLPLALTELLHWLRRLLGLLAVGAPACATAC